MVSRPVLRPRLPWAWSAVFWLLLLVAPAATPAGAQERQAAEHAVKAAFVFRFGEYVEWPDGTFADADAPLRIGVVGADPVATELERIAAGLRVGGRRVVVVRPPPGSDADGLQVLFVGGPGGDAAAPSANGTPPLLTITEVAGAMPRDSVINLVVVDGKVRFDVSLSLAQSRGLRVSSRLLALARRVEGPR